MVQVYAPTSSHEDQRVESFYEDMETAMGSTRHAYSAVEAFLNTAYSFRATNRQIGNMRSPCQKFTISDL